MFSDCSTHQKNQCFKCNFEKTCDGLSAHIDDPDRGCLTPSFCDVMEISEYESLVTSQSKALQVKVAAVIDEAIKTMDSKQTELMNNIKRDPRKIDIEMLPIKLVLETHRYIHRDTNKKIYYSDSSEGYYDENARWWWSTGIAMPQ